jgi:hypothetical protein
MMPGQNKNTFYDVNMVNGKIMLLQNDLKFNLNFFSNKEFENFRN